MNRTRRHMLNAALAAVTLALGFGVAQASASPAAKIPFLVCRSDLDCFHSSQCGSNGGTCNYLDGYCDCFPIDGR